nr:alpha-L-arabinofuranosidase C-terminal domain-containing protein [uncultured Eisenbergiella sp.]
MGKITVRTEKKRFPIAPNLYGIFFEDINRAGDGGLYPELLRNRSFEDSIEPKDCRTGQDGYALVSRAGWRDEFNHGEGLSRWVRKNGTPYTPIPAWYTNHAQMSLDRNDTLNPHRQVSLAVSFEEGGELYNTGFCGIAPKAGEKYLFYMFARTEAPVKIRVSVEEDGHEFGCMDFLLESGGYVRYDGSFAAEGDGRNARLVFGCPEGGKVNFGFCSLMPEDTYMGHGLRRDLVEKLRDMNPRFLRFPGGCIVEGFSPETAMQFKNVVGPVWERPGHQLMWHYRSYNGLGFHEYLQLCEDLDMEPLYVCNCGMTCQGRSPEFFEGEELASMLQDTLDAIEYAVGDKTSRWGSLRAKMGHPEPFRLTYIEIGNENSGPAYEARYQMFYDAIRARYPHIRLIANTHLEEQGLGADIVDEHYYSTAEFFAENVNFYDKYDRNKPKIFLGELAVVRGWVGQLYGALGEAAFLIGMERNQDVVELASYAPLLENVDYNAWFPNLIRFNNRESIAIPTYYVWKMFGNNRGENVVEADVETGTLYRPVKGMASLMGQAGLRYRNASWNKTPVGISHELMGRVKEEEGVSCILPPDEEQRAEAETLHRVDKDRVFVVFGEEQVTSGVFDIDIYAEEGREICLGVYSGRMPKEVYMADETHPPKEWNAANVKPFLWTLEKGISTFRAQKFPSDRNLDEERKAELRYGEFNHFRYEADGKQMKLYVNGECIHQVDVPSFPSLSSVVCDSPKEVIIKIVNMSPEEDAVEISLDCEVEDAYEVTLLTGEKQAENSFEEPEKVHDVVQNHSGASSHFYYGAPAYSVNVLRLAKIQMQ